MSSESRPQSFCSSCGQSISAGAHFCANCGQPVLPPDESGDPPATVLDQPQQAEWLLTILTGPDQGKGYPVGQRLVIGRDQSCDVILPDPKASRQHATIEQVSLGRYLLLDLDSSNGTFLLEQPVERAELVPGAQIRIGETQMTLAPEAESCPSCGQLLANGNELCPHCGQQLDQPADFDLERRMAELESQAGINDSAEVPSAPAEPAAAPSSGQAGSLFRAAEPEPVADPKSRPVPQPPPQTSSRSPSLRRLAAIGCLLLVMLMAAAACCAVVGPLLEELA